MTAQKGTQIMGWARLCLSLHLVSLWCKCGWRNGAFKRLWRLFILTAFLVLFGDVGLPNQARSRATAWRTFLLCAPGAYSSFLGVILGFMGCAHLSGQDCALYSVQPWSDQCIGGGGVTYCVSLLCCCEELWSLHRHIIKSTIGREKINSKFALFKK